MPLEAYRAIFISIALIGILLFSLPTLGLIVQSPEGEPFSELYMLGPSRTFQNIPFNVKTGMTYSVYLGVGNHMGQSGYYTCVVKLRNETEPLPNLKLGIPSTLPVLYEYTSFIKNGEVWEKILEFQINGLTFSDNKAEISNITLNGLEFQVNKVSMWNSNKTGYYYNLFVELWSFDPNLGVSHFNNRSVHLILNVTQ